MISLARRGVFAPAAIAILLGMQMIAPLPSSADVERARVTVPFDPLPGHGAPIVEVRFPDGTVGHFMIDTGASLCCMTDTFARKLHLKSYAAGMNGRALYMGSDHGQQSQAVDVKAMNLGTLTLTNVSFVLIRQSEFFRFGETPVDGLIGENVFRQAAMLIDYPHDTLTVIFPGGLTDAEVAALGMSGVKQVPLRRSRRRDHADSGELFADLTLTDGSQSVTDELIVDTGAPDTSISQLAAEKLGLQAIARRGASTMGDGSYYGSVGIVPQVTVGDLALSDLQVSYPGRDRVSRIPPLLGEDVLGYCVALFDLPNNRLLLKPALPPVNSQAATVPLTASHADFTRLCTLAGELPIPDFQTDLTGDSAYGDATGGPPARLSASARIAALRAALLRGDDTQNARAYDRLGDALWADGQHEAAAKSYQKSVALYRTLAAAKPDDAQLQAAFSLALTDAGGEEEAETVARHALVSSPKEPKLYAALGWALYTRALQKLTGSNHTVIVSSDHLDEFTGLVTRLRANPPTHADEAAVEAGAQAAGQAFDRAIEVAPDAVSQAQAYRQRGLFRQASGLGITATLAALRGDNPDVLADAYTVDAVSDFAQAADRDPQNIDLLRQAAQEAVWAPIVRNEHGIDLREGKTWDTLPASSRKQAHKQIDRLTLIAQGTDKPRAARAWEALGQIDLEYVEDRDRAATDLKAALEADPASDFATYEFVSLMRDDRRYDAIIALLQPLVAGHDSASRRLSLAYADAKLERWNEALANAERARALQPENFDANLAVASLSLEAFATGTSTSQHLKIAKECLDTALLALGGKPSPEQEAEYRHTEALYDAMNLQPDAARTVLLETLRTNRTDTRAREIMGALLN